MQEGMGAQGGGCRRGRVQGEGAGGGCRGRVQEEVGAGGHGCTRGRVQKGEGAGGGCRRGCELFSIGKYLYIENYLV